MFFGLAMTLIGRYRQLFVEPKERIVHGLTQSTHHASQSGLAETVPGKHLAALLTQIAAMPEVSLDRAWRAKFELEVTFCIKGFSDLAIQRQPDFRPGP
jgi:hypothetical protein